MMLIAASGVFSSVMGTYISYHIDGATGGCIVVLQTLIFVGTMILPQARSTDKGKAEASDLKLVIPKSVCMQMR